MRFDKNPTAKYKKELTNILSRLEREEKIRQEDKKVPCTDILLLRLFLAFMAAVKSTN